MRRILELVQSKGEECSAYLIHVLHEAHDAYIDLRPWFSDIHYNPLESIRVIPVINTDPSEFHSVKITHTHHTQKYRYSAEKNHSIHISWVHLNRRLGLSLFYPTNQHI